MDSWLREDACLINQDGSQIGRVCTSSPIAAKTRSCRQTPSAWLITWAHNVHMSPPQLLLHKIGGWKFVLIWPFSLFFVATDKTWTT